MRIMGILICLAFFPNWLPAQNNEFYELSSLPWNGDWLEQRADQLVHGERYRGYPGPIPKMFSALGLDADHPSVDYELIHLVRRDSPYWHGSCNGWAAAAIQFGEPSDLVVNGVKLFSGEVKAILSSIWKNNVEVRVGRYDSVGLTAQSFEELLYDYIASDRPIIFDVAVGAESWNYPVSGFERVTSDNGDWTDVAVTVFYTHTRSLKNVDLTYGEVFLNPVEYTYRISKADPNFYEWTGSAVSVRPHRAWYPTLPYLPERWFKVANRYFNMGTYNRLMNLSTRENAFVDLYEPNNSVESARALTENLLLGSLHENADKDWYRISVEKDELVSFQIAVYDGPSVTVDVLKADGSVVAQYLDAEDQELTLPFEQAGTYFIGLGVEERPLGEGESFVPSFYKIQFSENRSWYRSPLFSGLLGDLSLGVINIEEEPNELTVGETFMLPASGSHQLASVDDGYQYRASARALWVGEGGKDARIWKKYFREHPLKMPYTIPHLTFRNGWETKIEVAVTDRSSDVFLQVFDKDGRSLQKVLVNDDVLTGRIPLRVILTDQARSNGAWLQLQTDHQNLLSGITTFEHRSGITSFYDIEGQPRNGEMILFDLPPVGTGWTGISLLNTSGIENEIIYRLIDEKGGVLDENVMILQPGQRWLGVPETLTGFEVQEGYALYFFCQYDVESLVLRYDAVRKNSYAHRLLNTELDKFSTSFISISDPEKQTLVLSNVNNRTNWASMEAYSADGVNQGVIRIGGRAMKAWETGAYKMADLLADDNLAGATAPITHFSMITQHPLFIHELIGEDKHWAKTFVRTVNIYQDP